VIRFKNQRQRSARELGQHRRVGRAGQERVEHRPPGDAEDVAGEAVELDPGVLEDLVQPVGLTLTFPDLRLAVAVQVARSGC
jgi:hypothetical protein